MPEPRNLALISKALGVDPSDLTLPVENDPTSDAARFAAAQGNDLSKPRVTMNLANDGRARVEVSALVPMAVAIKLLEAVNAALAEAE